MLSLKLAIVAVTSNSTPPHLVFVLADDNGFNDIS